MFSCCHGDLSEEEDDAMFFSDDENKATSIIDPGNVLIPEVVTHLCKFLGVKDVKQCRLVCESWNYGAIPVLQERTYTTLRLYSKNYSDDHPERWTGLVERLQFHPNDIRLYSANLNASTLPPTDINIFPTVTNVKSIFVEFFSDPGWEQELCYQILLSSAPTLENLQFVLGDPTQDFSPLCDTVFPRLKQAVIEYCQEPRYTCNVTIGRLIMEDFTNLECLQVEGRLLLGISKAGELSMLPTSLIVAEEVNANVMKCLLDISVPLRKLTLQFIYLKNDANRVYQLPLLLYKLLKKHSSTLEELKFYMKWAKDNVELEWKLPVFPVMKDLTIGNNFWFRKVEFETGLIWGPLESEKFGRIDYKVCFPRLESLTVTTGTEDFSSLAVFLPPEDSELRVAESVRKVSLSSLSHPNHYTVARANLYAELLEIFPNARDSITFT
ncbi:uncharacterized protein LOC110859477 isoform X2 [Folsomia candida]|uniref:uncharacterized protein LOC110859477 isoform X2 n=1 Tax=Folsomia candida TaxID=158441 RepID=UPI001605589F|nr:uncharacterized protein LOC110859477 isoform X2 [Folsomia candida]